MKRRKKPANKSNPSFIFFWVFLISFIAIVCFGAVFVYLYSRPQLKPLKRLTIPAPPKVELPGPLSLLPNTSPVLGAETESFDPHDIITYVNQERLVRGIPPLRLNPILDAAAKLRADVMLKHQNFSHQDPYEHIELATVLPMVNYPFAYATENIGMGGISGKDFVNGFMSSTMHRTNLLNPALVETGASVVTGQYGQYHVHIVAHLFAVPWGDTSQYASKDLAEYQQLLKDVGNQLTLTKKLMENDVEKQAYYESWQRILLRQQEILAALYYGTKSQQPLFEQTVILIREYNENWNLLPQPI